MDFTIEEREKIDKILKQVREEQKQNGNKLYLFTEVANNILDRLDREEKEYRKLQNLYNR